MNQQLGRFRWPGVTRKFHVLLVDDDANDRLLFASALEQSGLEVDMFEATDGYAAMNYLLGHPDYTDREEFPLPDLVFLDLKMLGMDGFAVLKEIRRRRNLMHLPVIIFSNSTMMSDMKAAFALGANAFYQKPARYCDLVNLLRAVLTPWQHEHSRVSEGKSRAH
jgi:two-component system response regulator